MSKFIEILAMVLGGLSLFVVAFLGFASMSGKSLGSTPGLGGFFESESTDPSNPAPAAAATATLDEAPSERSDAEVVEASIGMMGAWSLPSPYTEAELEELITEVKGRLQLLELRENDLDQREADLVASEQTIKGRFEALEDLQQRLETFGHELELREQEVLRREADRRQKDLRQWEEVAAVLGALDPSVAGQRLAEYDPAEAAFILRSMDPAVASEIVNQVPERWKEYVDAYTSLGPASGGP